MFPAPSSSSLTIARGCFIVYQLTSSYEVLVRNTFAKEVSHASILAKKMKTAVGQMCEIWRTGTPHFACVPSLSTNFPYMKVQEKNLTLMENTTLIQGAKDLVM